MLCPKPTLKGNRVLLRPLSPLDIEPYLMMLNDAEGQKLTGSHGSFSREVALGWLQSLGEKENRVDLGIVRLDSGVLVGEVVLNQLQFEDRNANLRIGIGPAHHRGLGFGTEALSLLVGWAFEHLPLHRLSLEVFEFNPRAAHVYEKLGFIREGLLRQCLLWEGSYYNAILMSMLKPEYEARRPSTLATT